jgi:hypothetical protein
MRVLVDADAMVYGCGFAAQKKDESGNVVAEPVGNALALAKSSLTAIYDEVNTWLLASGEKPVDFLELFLTGKDNFRNQIATIRGYKANRIGKPKPVHYQAIRDYLVDHWAATVVDGHEADDELAIQAAKEGYDADRVMIASVDKDLKTVPGLLYSFKKKEAYLLSEKEALVNFYQQMIVGDTADNIVGVYKAGPKVAKKITEDLSTPAMWNRVLVEFDYSIERKGCPYKDPLAAAIETGRLLHLLRYPGEVWEPPT